MVVVVDIVVEFHDGREREKKFVLWLALSSIESSSSSVRRQSHQSRFFPFFFLFDDDSLVFATKALPSNVWDNALFSLAQKNTRERDPETTPTTTRGGRENRLPDVPRRRIRRAASSRVVVLSFSRHRCHLIHRRRSRGRTRHNPIQKQKGLDQSGTTPRRGVVKDVRRKERERERERENERQKKKRKAVVVSVAAHHDDTSTQTNTQKRDVLLYY